MNEYVAKPVSPEDFNEQFNFRHLPKEPWNFNQMFYITWFYSLLQIVAFLCTCHRLNTKA